MLKPTFTLQPTKLRFIWLLLVLLVLAQLLLAIHEVGHLSEELDEIYCEICFIGNSLDQVPLPAGLKIPPIISQTYWQTIYLYAFYTYVLTVYWARGPPKS